MQILKVFWYQKMMESEIQINLKHVAICVNNVFMFKYQKHDACSYGCKLVTVDDKCSKRFQSYLGQDVIYNLVNSMIKESKYYTDMMKKHFNKELVMIKKDEESGNSTDTEFLLREMLK